MVRLSGDVNQFTNYWWPRQWGASGKNALTKMHKSEWHANFFVPLFMSKRKKKNEWGTKNALSVLQKMWASKWGLVKCVRYAKMGSSNESNCITNFLWLLSTIHQTGLLSKKCNFMTGTQMYMKHLEQSKNSWKQFGSYKKQEKMIPIIW